jgi:TPR repeat protein
MSAAQTHFETIETRASAGDLDAQYYLSLLYEGIKDCPKNLQKSAAWCTKAAQAGDKQAQYRLSKLHETGKGFDKARERVSWYWLRESASKGHTQAQFELGVRHLFGTTGVRKSLNHARRYLLEAANHDHAEAMYYLGFMHMHALGCPHDCGSAYMWFCRSAELNCEKAQCSLGFFYAHGICCDQDMELARYWYERAAMRGHVGAQFALGCLYTSLGQKKNAVVWMSICANQGIIPAQALLAKMYLNGLGITRDLVSALKWCLIVESQIDVDIESLEITLKCKSQILEIARPSLLEDATAMAREWFLQANHPELAYRL